MKTTKDRFLRHTPPNTRTAIHDFTLFSMCLLNFQFCLFFIVISNNRVTACHSENKYKNSSVWSTLVKNLKWKIAYNLRVENTLAVWISLLKAFNSNYFQFYWKLESKAWKNTRKWNFRLQETKDFNQNEILLANQIIVPK